MKTYISKSVFENDTIAKEIIDNHLSSQKIWLLEGEMGAGKTTFTNSILKQLGTNDKVSSPTFSIMNIYLSNHLGEIFHFDFYRIKDEEEALEIGVEDYLYSNQLCIIEWSSKIPNLIPENHLKISIQINENNERVISILSNG